MYDITWCTNSKKCNHKDCRRIISKRPKNLGCWYSISDFYEEGKECKHYWKEDNTNECHDERALTEKEKRRIYNTENQRKRRARMKESEDKQ